MEAVIIRFVVCNVSNYYTVDTAWSDDDDTPYSYCTLPLKREILIKNLCNRRGSHIIVLLLYY